MVDVPVFRRSVPKRALRAHRKQDKETFEVTTMRSVDPAFRRQLDGYSLATAEITYHLPDAHSVLQTFLWQQYDLAPQFPELKKFLEFWGRELDGPVHSVRIAHAGLIKPAEFRFADHEITVH